MTSSGSDQERVPAPELVPLDVETSTPAAVEPEQPSTNVVPLPIEAPADSLPAYGHMGDEASTLRAQNWIIARDALRAAQGAVKPPETR